MESNFFSLLFGSTPSCRRKYFFPLLNESYNAWEYPSLFRVSFLDVIDTIVILMPLNVVVHLRNGVIIRFHEVLIKQ